MLKFKLIVSILGFQVIHGVELDGATAEDNLRGQFVVAE